MSLRGTVFFIDASLASADLLSVRAHRFVQSADAIVASAGVAAELTGLAKPGAEIITTGGSAPDVLLRLAASGKKVARLTLGDPLQLAAAGEEVPALEAAGHTCEVVPAITLLPLPARPGATAPQLHQPAIIFLTGLSGSGKSTLSTALEQNLRARGLLTAVVDGDALRTGLTKGLGFSEEDRRENVRRASELALHLAGIGAVAIVALISPFRADRAAAAARSRARGIPFAEVFINAPLAVCEQRDPKHLYKRARAGQIPSFTGIDSPYEAPLAPDLELHTDAESIAESVARLTAFALRLARPSAGPAGPATANS